jgi:hypothetical protein
MCFKQRKDSSKRNRFFVTHASNCCRVGDSRESMGTIKERV